MVMFHKIMVSYDDSSEADRALDAAIKLTKALQAELRIVTVLEPLPTDFSWDVSPLPANRWIERTRTKHTLRQTAARQTAKAAGIRLDTELVDDGDEVDRIIESAKRNRADLLVVGLRQDTLLIDQPAKEIAARSPCALLCVR
jgi:nucleotide-binding universal stress UspA family protein